VSFKEIHMPRLSPIDPKSATGRIREIFDGPLKGLEKNIFLSMAGAPAILEMYLGIAGAAGKMKLSAKERETIQLAIGNSNRCDYCVAAHTMIGKGAGLTDAQTIEARKGRMQDAKLNALVAFSLALHEKRGFVSDNDVAAFKAAGYTDENVAEVVGVYTLAIFTNYFNHVNQTPVDFPAAPALA
jgi:AhpD family alkylhydroperoxidase